MGSRQDLRIRCAGIEPGTGIWLAETGVAGAEPDARLLGDEEQLGRAAERTWPAQSR